MEHKSKGPAILTAEQVLDRMAQAVAGAVLRQSAQKQEATK